ncbi:hypothetical protein MKW94_023263 [Papaver nudicaule]|uniref:Molybdopterin synthase catalytic subunit n=1 Tax=Papaver nudicaule TaxID=74823 RepID=A0AA41VWB9_PAPNU|nr:hypothetical protein [Papaver nudicaule]
MDSENEKTLVEILEPNIQVDLAKYIKFVSNPQSGAIATFSGTTRDTFEGKIVVELRYEAYVPMAERQIKSICSSARLSWSLEAMAVAHRLGSVPVGETSVFVAISSVHRDDALDACKYVIDELKASVPIFKKEVYANGEVWKENSEFLERRDQYSSHVSSTGGRVCCGSKVHKVPVAKEKKICCGNKTKVRDEEAECAS